jgi:hypothetical protein
MEVLVARSDDEGKSWTLSNLVPHAPHPMERKPVNPRPLKIHEPAIAELADGSLFMLARSSVGWLYRSISKDGGETWTPFQPTKIASLVAPPYLHRCSDGRIALLWNPIVGEGGSGKGSVRRALVLLILQRSARCRETAESHASPPVGGLALFFFDTLLIVRIVTALSVPAVPE